MSFLINESSISESQILTDLKSFLDSRPDAAQFQAFFESQVGTTILKYFQGLASYFAFKSVVGRREAFPLYSKSRSSVIGGSQFQGYSSFRGRNQTVTLTITPNFTGTIQKFDSVGVVSSAELISLETKVVNEDQTTTLLCVVGNKAEKELTASSDEPSFFRFEGNGRVSDDLRVIVDGNEAPLADNLLEVLDDKFFVQTNAVGAVDVFSQNRISAPVRFDAGDTILLEYVELLDFTFTDDEIDFDFGIVTNIERTSLFQDVESLDSIRVNAPVQNQVRDVIRAREDQPKQFQNIDPTVIDATGDDLSAAVMILYYLREGGILFNEDEVNELLSEWETYRPFGQAPPVIAAPTRKPIKLKVDATLEDNPGTPEEDVEGILDSYRDDLEATISLVELEELIEDLDGIRIARPTFDGEDWQASTKLEMGQHVKATPDNGKLYQVLEILYFSGGSEPTWPTNEGGETVVDGDIVWESVPKNDTAGFQDWQANTSYKEGSEVRPTTDNGFIFKVKRLRNLSGSSEPTWPALGGDQPSSKVGEKVIDGDILWITRELTGNPSAWQANNEYKKGDLIVTTDPQNSDTVGLMFQAFAYLGTTGGSQPTFPTVNDQTVDDNNIRFTTQSPNQTALESGKDSYFSIDLDFDAS